MVIFALLLDMLTSGATPTATTALMLLLREGVGGMALGLVLGYVTFRLLKSVDQYQVEVLLTLAVVMGVTRWPIVCTPPGHWRWSSPVWWWAIRGARMPCPIRRGATWTCSGNSSMKF